MPSNPSSPSSFDSVGIFGGECRSILPPSSFESQWEDPRYPIASMTTERGEMAGGVASPHLEAEDSLVGLSSLPLWSLTPLPEASLMESDESFVLPSLPPWPFTPLPVESDESFVLQEDPVVKKRKMEVGLISAAPFADEVVGGDDDELDLVEIAKLRGWNGLMDLNTLQMLKCLLPLYFQHPYPTDE